MITLLQIAITTNGDDRTLIRPLQEGLDVIKRPEDNIIVHTENEHYNTSTTTTDQPSSINNSSSDQHDNNNAQVPESGVLPKRSFSFDLPGDGSMKITEEQLKALGSFREHLWKSLRFKLQRFFVANVTTPQVGS